MTPLWVFVTDETRGRLLRLEWTGAAGAVVTLDDEICESCSSTSIAGRNHGKPFAGFAGEIAVWLERQADQRPIEKLAVFAPQPLLDLLREAWSPRFAMLVAEHECDLTALTPEQLGRHPAICALFEDASHGYT